MEGGVVGLAQIYRLPGRSADRDPHPAATRKWRTPDAAGGEPLFLFGQYLSPAGADREAAAPSYHPALGCVAQWTEAGQEERVRPFGCLSCEARRCGRRCRSF